MAVDVASAVYSSLLGQLAVAPAARVRASLVRSAAATLGCTVNTVYKHLGALGWKSGRKVRKDKGTSAALSADAGLAVASIAAQGRNKRGEANIGLKEALVIAQEQGLVGEVSYAHATRVLRERGLGAAQLRAPAPHIHRVSSHPNHVHFLDISVAIQWYFRDASGKKVALHSDAGARFYEGKRENLTALRQVIHRYVLTDHYSGAYYVRYYYTSGERGEDVVDFLYRAWASKGPLAQAMPFRGLPRRLVMDQGSAFRCALVQSLLVGLDVKPEHHGVKNPKASGSVESRHGHWQRSYEGRLALKPAPDLDTLNTWAEKWCSIANAERPHRRHGRPPMAVWVGIDPERLREVPDRPAFLQLASAKPAEGTLDAAHHLRAKGGEWLCRGEHLYAGQKVQYRLSPFLPGGVRVWDEFGRELSAQVVKRNEAGLPVEGARRHVWDDASAPGSSAPLSPANKVVQRVLQTPVRLDEVFGDLDQRIARQAFLSPTGKPWAPAAGDPLAAPPMLGDVDALELVVSRLGRGLSVAENTWWRNQLGPGCTRAELDELYAVFSGSSALSPSRAQMAL